MQLRVCALQPAEKGGVKGLGRAGLVSKLRWEGSLVPHPWPVHFRSSAIHEFSCCSSPTSKMMSVRSFTWWKKGAAVWVRERVCMCSPGCGSSVTHLQHKGIEVVGHLEACASPDLLEAGAGCL